MTFAAKKKTRKVGVKAKTKTARTPKKKASIESLIGEHAAVVFSADPSKVGSLSIGVASTKKCPPLYLAAANKTVELLQESIETQEKVSSFKKNRVAKSASRLKSTKASTGTRKKLYNK